MTSPTTTDAYGLTYLHWYPKKYLNTVASLILLVKPPKEMKIGLISWEFKKLGLKYCIFGTGTPFDSGYWQGRFEKSSS